MKELMFQDTSLKLIERNGRQWVGAADISRALGYARADMVTRLFDRHSQEFTQSMTAIFETSTLGGSGNLTTKTRFFSLRGAHLVAMFARTIKGQEFRKWVLDVLEDSQNHPSIDKSLMQQWFDAKAKLDAQDKFASLCGRGLNEHKKVKPPLKRALDFIDQALQPTLFNQAA
jgi:prophage antirepressor-like protein